ncbi:MAG: hypothetical protein V4671_29995 [Armatimonadota bacterium]
MKKQTERITTLAQGLESRQIVRIIAKATPDENLDGFIVSLSEAFVLLHVLDGGHHMELNGYLALPMREIKSVRVLDDHDSFCDRALKVKGIAPQPQPDILLLDFPGLLSSANAHFPLVAVNQERQDRGCCFIGRVEKLKKRSFTLHKIDPAAHWIETEKFFFDDITRIDFGGGYEEALWLVSQSERSTAATKGTEE